MFLPILSLDLHNEGHKVAERVEVAHRQAGDARRHSALYKKNIYV